MGYYDELKLVRLLLVTVLTAFCADWRECTSQAARALLTRSLVVASIEETAKQYHISKAFIGYWTLPFL